MKLHTLLAALLVFCAMSSAAFNYVGFYNGTNHDDSNAYWKFSQPTGLLIVEGKLYVADSGRNALYQMKEDYAVNSSPRLKFITGQANDGAISNPQRMAYENGILYIADGSSGKIRYYAGEGSTIEAWNTATNIEKATGLVFGNDSFYITDGGKGKLYAYSRQTKSYDHIAIETGGSDGFLTTPMDIRQYGEKYYIPDAAKNIIFVYGKDFKFEYSIGRGKGNVELRSPRGIRVYEGRVYVADRNQNRVVVFTMDGYPVETLGSSPAANFSYPEDIEVANGKLYVADSGNALVHIFSINYSNSGNDSVLNGIALANLSSSNLKRLQSAAMTLGISPKNVSFDAQIADAQHYYDQFIFSSAVSLSQTVIDTAVIEHAALGSEMDVKMRQILKAAQDKVDPYRPKATDAALKGMLSSFDGTVAQLSGKLSAKDYAGAAPLALLLQGAADDFVKAYNEKILEDKVKSTGQETQRLESMRNSLGQRLAAVKAKAAACMQTADFANADRLFAAATSEIDDDNFDAANRTLSFLEVEITTFEASLYSICREIDAALANITVIEFDFNATVSKPMLLPPNVDAERTLLAQARVSAYSNPQLGIAMAAQARETAKTKAKEAQTYSIGAAALLMMLGIIGVIAVAFFIHLRGRNRRHDAAKEAAGHEEEAKRGEHDEKAHEHMRAGHEKDTRAKK